MSRIVAWVSCGTASAVNAKLMIDAAIPTGHEVALVRCIVPEEHPDNDRFAADLEVWLGQPIINLKSDEFENCEAVWKKRRYMSGVAGAPCTIEMKKAVRWKFEQDWHPDWQSFGYTADELHRVERFERENPEIKMISMLVKHGLSKADCHAIIVRAGLQLPAMYRLGFQNANCIGCVKAQGPNYWALVRKHFPEVFKARAALSRELGVTLIKGTSGERERSFLDELPSDAEPIDNEPNTECSLLCYLAEGSMKPSLGAVAAKRRVASQ
jgi:hypothetical protein